MVILVTGGSGSGKSEFAEKLLTLLQKENRIYIATMEPFGEEAWERIQRHQLQRSSRGFRTIERYKDIGKLTTQKAGSGQMPKEDDPGREILPPHCGVLLECMSNLAANEMFDRERRSEFPGNEMKEDGSERIRILCRKICSDIHELKNSTDNLVIVTNEIFSESSVYLGDTVRYQELLGRINRCLGDLSDAVVEVVYGIPVVLKGGEKLEGIMEQL